MLIGTLKTVQHNFLDHEFTDIDLNYDERGLFKWQVPSSEKIDMIMFSIDEIPGIIIPRLVFECKKHVKFICLVHENKYNFEHNKYGLEKLDDRDGYFIGFFK